MTSLRTPEADLDRAFSLAVEQAEIVLRPGSDVSAADRIRVAASLLAAGVRAPARALLRGRQEAGTHPEAARQLADLSRQFSAWVGEPPGSPGEPRAEPASPASLAVAADELRKFPDRPAAVAGMLDAVLRDLWGIVPDAPAAAVAIRPTLPADWPTMALARLRVGRTVLDLELRRRRDALVARVHRAGGPPLVVTLELQAQGSGPTFVDEVELQGPRVRFEAVERHEIVAHGGSG